MSVLVDHYRTAFVTGASSGLGRAFTDMLLAEGLEVWGTARDLARLPARTRFHPLAVELADGAAAVRTMAEAEAAAGGLDVVINNAGYGVYGGFERTDFAVWQRQIEVMLLSPARLAQLALRGMLARGRGALVNVSSMAVEFPLPFQSAYNLAKAGLSGLSESLMAEVAGTGVVVIDLRPGDYRTDFDGTVQREPETFTPRMARGWKAFAELMRHGPPPAHAAAGLRRALLARRSGTVRIGRFFQIRLAPLLVRLGSQRPRRFFQARYFDVAP